MKKLLTITIGLLLFVIWIGGTAWADNGPHGNYSAMTDKCAACHRAHTAKGDSLLSGSATATDRSAFCYSCHSGGTGAYTDVVNGIWTTTDSPLRGGGFDQVKMNTDFNPTGGSVLPTSSKHMVTGEASTVWGSGTLTTTVSYGATGVSLTCTNCHNPHGRAGDGNTRTYRILKGKSTENSPLFANGVVTNTANVDVLEDNGSGAKTYYLSQPNTVNGVDYYDAYFGEMMVEYRQYIQLTAWCSQCHTRYNAPISATTHPATQDSGDPVFTYRHGVNPGQSNTCSDCHNNGYEQPNFPRPGCMSCHVSHGTGATMGQWGGDVDWPDGLTVPNGHERSALLRLNNRGVCEACHQK